MPATTICPGCQAVFNTAGIKVGKRLRCKKCKTAFTLTEAEPQAVAAQKPADDALPAAMGDRSSLARAKFKGGISLHVEKPPSSNATFDPLSLAAPAPSVLNELTAGNDEEKYTVEDELARGGMGMILRAQDRDIRRQVAMKVMLREGDENTKARFVEEAQVTGQLEHPNIVPIHELGVDSDGRLFFTMKLVKGRSLSEVLKSMRKKDAGAKPEYSLGRLLNAFMNVCNAMAFAHAKGVVHRDLKPANIMLGSYGEVLVMDWGLAKVGAANVSDKDKDEENQQARDAAISQMVKSLRDESSGTLTLEGAIIGTPHYMPPEQADGLVSQIDARSDIYSLGAILYEILTLKTPCEGNSIHMLIMNVSQGNIKPPEVRTPERQIPKELSAIALKALAHKKEDRYQSIEALRHDIELFLEGRAVSAKQDTSWETFVKLMKRNKGVSITATAATVLLLAAGAFSYWVNYDARQRAERNETVAKSALELLQVEQQRRQTEELARRAEQKKSVPAFVEGARAALSQKKFDDALAQINVALEYDPENAVAHLMKGQLLIFREEYAYARRELEIYLKSNPNDKDTKLLLGLVARAINGATNLSSEFADIFLRQKAFYYSDTMSGDVQKLIVAYNQKLRSAWPKLGNRQGVRINTDGVVEAVIGGEWLDSLEPLREMQLGALNLNNAAVQDLAPLKGLSLNQFYVSNVPIADLAPLKGMPLSVVHLVDTDINDLSPLNNIHLSQFKLATSADITKSRPCKVTSIEPLKGMPLTRIEINTVHGITDFSALKGAPLEHLALPNTKVSDLSFVEGMPLKVLHLSGCSNVNKITALKGLPLIEFRCDSTQVTDLTPLQGMPLTRLFCMKTHISDLTPLKEMRLTQLICDSTAVRDLEPLRRIPLQQLVLNNCKQLSDLSPLRDSMELTELQILTTGVTDVSPLGGTKLTTLFFNPEQIKKGMDVLRSMKTLVKLGPGKTLPADLFWKKYEAGEFNAAK